jgi:hypothetical protein
MMPRFPDPDAHEAPPSDEARDSATLLALAVLCGVGVALVLLVWMVLPDVFYIVLFVLTLPFYFVLHYLLWGRLMSRLQDGPSDPSAD